MGVVLAALETHGKGDTDMNERVAEWSVKFFGCIAESREQAFWLAEQHSIIDVIIRTVRKGDQEESD